MKSQKVSTGVAVYFL